MAGLGSQLALVIPSLPFMASTTLSSPQHFCGILGIENLVLMPLELVLQLLSPVPRPESL